MILGFDDYLKKVEGIDFHIFGLSYFGRDLTLVLKAHSDESPAVFKNG